MITQEMLKNGDLREGDFVRSLVDLIDPNTGKKVLDKGEEYQVTGLYPKWTPPGFVIMSNIGKWFMYFQKKGVGSNWFEKVVEKPAVGNEELELGEFGTLPLDILNLIVEKDGIKRREIIEYLSYKMTAPKVRNSIIAALRFLDVHDYVELLGGSLDKYTITAKGLKLLGMDKPKYQEPET